MRKHTGQFFRCKFCDFKSVNKSHVLEHEAVHSNVRHQCDICKKDYNTLKSLINHVRKYHKNTPKGEEYLSSFLQGGRQRGATVIHQCHVCNRKFKKKIDRDRHLYVHDIKDIPTIQMCSLCDYTASRKVYLEKHFQKHRVIYKCVKCEDKFLSTIRLIDHLTTSHIKDDETTKWESMFEECINNSLYLPEPDEMLSSAEKEFVSLPAELSQTDIEGKTRVEVEQMPGETTEAIDTMETEQKTLQEENAQIDGANVICQSKGKTFNANFICTCAFLLVSLFDFTFYLFILNTCTLVVRKLPRKCEFLMFQRWILKNYKPIWMMLSMRMKAVLI